MLNLFFETSNYIDIFYHFKTLRWHRYLRSFLVEHQEPYNPTSSISQLQFAGLVVNYGISNTIVLETL